MIDGIQRLENIVFLLAGNQRLLKDRWELGFETDPLSCSAGREFTRFKAPVCRPSRVHCKTIITVTVGLQWSHCGATMRALSGY